MKKERTLDAIGQHFGVTRERIRQLESMAHKTVRATLLLACSEQEHLRHENRVELAPRLRRRPARASVDDGLAALMMDERARASASAALGNLLAPTLGERVPIQLSNQLKRGRWWRRVRVRAASRARNRQGRIQITSLRTGDVQPGPRSTAARRR